MAKSSTDRLVEESERLRRWLADMGGELGSYVRELAQELREGDEDCDTGPQPDGRR